MIHSVSIKVEEGIVTERFLIKVTSTLPLVSSIGHPVLPGSSPIRPNKSMITSFLAKAITSFPLKFRTSLDKSPFSLISSLEFGA